MLREEEPVLGWCQDVSPGPGAAPAQGFYIRWRATPRATGGGGARGGGSATQPRIYVLRMTGVEFKLFLYTLVGLFNSHSLNY